MIIRATDIVHFAQGVLFGMIGGGAARSRAHQVSFGSTVQTSRCTLPSGMSGLAWDAKRPLEPQQDYFARVCILDLTTYAAARLGN
jgi:hypothetical protein